jgi:hypothetical protein
MNIYRLNVLNAPRRYIVDLKYAKRLAVKSWKFVPRMQRARATIRKGKPRVFLHKYIVALAGKRWVEVYFANGNPFDCRLANLQPYRRDEEGTLRRLFKNKAVRLRGVFLKRSTGKFGAAIRVRGKYKHIGYFGTADEAATAYKREFLLAHPNLVQV